MLELGNLEAAAGGRAPAAAAYERLIRERPRASVLTEAYFNLGIVRERLDDGAAARAAYYQVVDRAPAHELAPVAYVKIGRSYLDQGEYEQAISPLRRAVAAAAGTTSQPAAVVALAAAYLLTGNPRAANAVLVEFREGTALEPFRPTTAFLDAFAHYRTATDRLQIKREASGVLAALLAMPEESILGPAGLLLMGQAYGELGFGDRMARSYERALPQARGALAGELTCLTADALTANNQRPGAVKLLEPLAAKEGKPWSARATFRLAEIALEDKRPDDCLQQCARLQRMKTEDDPLPFLKLMGQAYVQLGNSRQAARCFGGLWPEQ
jgi:tetratricopeptide (TPR) repeat protein